VGTRKAHELAVDNVLQGRVHDLLAVEFDRDGAGSGDVAAVAGEPDRRDLAGAFVLRDDTSLCCRAEARVRAVETVIVRTVSAEAGELLGPHAGLQLGQPVEVPVDVPPDRTVRGGRRACRRTGRRDNW
jgi:hypothetical protein